MKTWGFCSSFKSVGRRGAFEEGPQRCISRGRRSTRDMFIRDVRRSGRWFPEELHFGASNLQFWKDYFVWQVQHFVWPGRPGLTFSWQAQYFRHMDWTNGKTHWREAVSSAFNFPLLKEVSQNCCVFDVVNLKNCGCLADLLCFNVVFKIWGSLAELLRFWRCQVKKLKEISQNCCVFKLADRQIDR